ncbi:osmotically inducible protein C, partial [Pseudoalteromonas sp. S327]
SLQANYNISEAEKIYASDKHPQIFIIFDNADHLLSNKKDAEYAATIIANWSNRYGKYEQSNFSAKL